MANPTDALHAWANSPQAAAAIKAPDAEVATLRKALIAERAELEKQCEQRPSADAARDQLAADFDAKQRAQIDTAEPTRRLKAAIENVGRFNAMDWRIAQIDHELTRYRFATDHCARPGLSPAQEQAGWLSSSRAVAGDPTQYAQEPPVSPYIALRARA